MDRNYYWGWWYSGPLYFKEWICSISAIMNFITQMWIYCLSSMDFKILSITNLYLILSQLKAGSTFEDLTMVKFWRFEYGQMFCKLCLRKRPLDYLTCFCPPLHFCNQVPAFAVRETGVSRHNGGPSGAPLNPLETIVFTEHYRLWGA